MEHEKEVKNIMVQLYTQEEALNLYIEDKVDDAVTKIVLFKLSKGMNAQEISQDLGLDLERVEKIIAKSKKTA